MVFHGAMARGEGPSQYGVTQLKAGLVLHSWTVASPDPTRPVLVALHGWADDGAVFAPVACSLAEACDVFAPDFPGHGGTPWTGSGPFRFSELVAPACAAVDHAATAAEGRPLVLLGHSMGAAIALRVAARRPGVVSHLVCEEPPVPPRIGWRERRKDIRWRRRMQTLDPAARIAELSRFAEWSQPELVSWAGSMGRADLSVLSTLRRFDDLLPTPDVRVTVPLTVVLGQEEGGRRGDAVLRRYLNAGHGETVVVRVGRGHNPRREDPDGFAEMLVGVLNTAGQRGETSVT